jgi:hypothetical protein
LKTTSLDRLALIGGLIIAIPAIMPHAQERSKQKRETRYAMVHAFRETEWVTEMQMSPHHREGSVWKPLRGSPLLS